MSENHTWRRFLSKYKVNEHSERAYLRMEIRNTRKDILFTQSFRSTSTETLNDKTQNQEFILLVELKIKEAK